MLFTIGHSNVELATVTSALRNFGIEAVVDVRSQPYSKYSPQFNRNELAAGLKRSGFAYAFMGQELGGRPDNLRYYDDKGFVRYDLWSQDSLFQAGIKRLARAAAERQLAVLCSEEDPRACHRHLLIARVLVDQGFSPANILHIRTSASNWECISDNEIPRQSGLLGEGTDWKSPQSVLRRVLRGTSSNGSDALGFAGSSMFG